MRKNASSNKRSIALLLILLFTSVSVWGRTESAEIKRKYQELFKIGFDKNPNANTSLCNEVCDGFRKIVEMGRINSDTVEAFSALVLMYKRTGNTNRYDYYLNSFEAFTKKNAIAISDSNPTSVTLFFMPLITSLLNNDERDRFLEFSNWLLKDYFPVHMKCFNNYRQSFELINLYYLLGVVFKEKGRYSEAETSFKKSIEEIALYDAIPLELKRGSGVKPKSHEYCQYLEVGINIALAETLEKEQKFTEAAQMYGDVLEKSKNLKRYFLEKEDLNKVSEGLRRVQSKKDLNKNGSKKTQ